MDDVSLGRRYRALRHRLGWRQRDAGDQAGVSQDLVSLVERGRIDEVSVRALRAVARALGGELRLELRFRGAELDRLMDEGHAALMGAVAARLEAIGWVVRPEVSFAVYGERGSIDLLAWHAASRTLLVVEVKTELVSVEETLRRHDAKVRLGAGVARDRFGWDAARVARLLVLPDASTPRRHVARHAEVLRAAYPVRGPSLRRWLRSPYGAVSGLAFHAGTSGGRGFGRSVSRRRIRRPSGLSDPGATPDAAAANDPGSSLVHAPTRWPSRHEPAS